jgi:hypothetical protein
MIASCLGYRGPLGEKHVGSDQARLDSSRSMSLQDINAQRTSELL